MEFKDRLRETRQQKHISQQKLADLMGMTKQAISHYERGTRKPDKDALLALADILNVSTDYLLGATDKTAQFVTDDELLCLNIIRENPVIIEVLKSNYAKRYIEYADMLGKVIEVEGGDK